MQILEGLRERYEAHHRVEITDEALAAAAELADRYISDRFLPDKAIDLIDEAASRMRIKSMTAPPGLPRARGGDRGDAAREGGGDRGPGVREGRQPARQGAPARRPRSASSRRSGRSGEGGERPAIGEEEIADIVSMWTGIPVFKLTEAETKKLLRMEDELHKRVIGQERRDHAPSRKAIRRARAGLKDPKRPAGSFIFLGPSGVGKTELATHARRVPVRRRGRADPHRHVRVHGEARGLAAWSARLPATSATTRAASSPRPCAASRTRWCCSTRSRRRTPTCSTSCCRSSRTAGSPTPRAARSTSATRS